MPCLHVPRQPNLTIDREKSGEHMMICSLSLENLNTDEINKRNI